MGWNKGEPLPLSHEEPTVIRDVIGVHRHQHQYTMKDLCDLARCGEAYFLSQYLPQERTMRIAN
jgi:hypothetical protein